MKFIETEKIELKKIFNETVIKELVGFLNSFNGTIYIGIADDGTIVGVDNVDKTMRDIADVITDKILPNPQDLIEYKAIIEENKLIVQIDVKKGNKLYYIKKYGRSATGCYKRIGTSSRGMSEDQIEKESKLTMSSNDELKDIKSNYKPITFLQLKIYYSSRNYHLNDETINENLELLTSNGDYNKLAELVSDTNRISFIFSRFHGLNKASIAETQDYGNQCIITAVTRMINRLEAENYGMSIVSTNQRIDKKLVDMNCVKEAVYNAIAYNDWISGNVPAVYMFDDRMEIISHGGLPKGQTEEDFFNGISRPRSNVLTRILRDLGFAERTGHGVPTIIEKYGKNVFVIKENYINVTIPYDEDVIASKNTIGVNNGVNEDHNNLEKLVIKEIELNNRITTKELGLKLGKGQRTIQRLVSESKKIKRIGDNRTGSWEIVA